jgi:hypothetical protein
MTGYIDEFLDELKQWAGLKAKSVDASVTGDPARVQELFDTHDLVVAVWQDDRQDSGFDILIVKGRPEAVVGRFDTSQSWIAIPCADADAASALRTRLEGSVRAD